MAGEACLSLPFPAHRDHTRLDVEKSRIPPFHTLHLHPSSTASHNISVLHAVILPSLPPARSPVLSPSTLPGLITFFSRNSKKKKADGTFYLFIFFFPGCALHMREKQIVYHIAHSFPRRRRNENRQKTRSGPLSSFSLFAIVCNHFLPVWFRSLYAILVIRYAGGFCVLELRE